MPIELTRRDVVKAGLLGAMGVQGVGCRSTQHTAPGPGAELVVDRVLVLSDTHIAGDAATLSRAGVNMAGRLDAVLDDALARRSGGAYRFGLINGDAAYDIGTTADYATLVDRLSPLPGHDVPTHILLGNHDDRANFRAVLKNPPSALHDKHVRKLGVAEGSRYCDWLLLDSLRVVDETPGELGGEQLVWLNETLQQDSERPVIIVVHHPPVPDENPEKPFALQDQIAFWALVESFHRVKAVLHGHTHRWEPRPRKVRVRTNQPSDVMMIGLPPTSYVFDEANPWGYVVADVDAGGVTFTLRAMEGHVRDGETVRVAFG